MFELALAIAGGIFLVIVLALLALFLIFRKKIKAGIAAAHTMYQSLQTMKNLRAQRVPVARKEVS